MRALTTALLLASTLLLGACTMPGATDDRTRLETDAGERAATPSAGGSRPDAAPAPQAPPSTPRPGADAQAPRAEPAPPMSEPLPPEPLPVATGGNVLSPDRSCRTDADCTVKNVGNCCGAMPACVNTNARTDPAAVQAQCARQGMSSVCGFKEVTACSCVSGTCQDGGAATR